MSNYVKKTQYVYPNSERFEIFSTEIKGKIERERAKTKKSPAAAKGQQQQFLSVKTVS